MQFDNTHRVAVFVSFIEFVHNLNPNGEICGGLVGPGLTRIPLRQLDLPVWIFTSVSNNNFNTVFARYFSLRNDQIKGCQRHKQASWGNDRGKKSKSVFDFLTYSRETGFSFSYGKVEGNDWPNGPSNEIDRVSKFDNSLQFGAKQKSLGQIFFALRIFKDLFTKNSNLIFFDFLWFRVGSIKECI